MMSRPDVLSTINIYHSSSSCCYIIVEKFPSLIIICSFFSRFCTSPPSSRCSAKASWASLEIAVLSSGGIYMAIFAYNPWGELIYHFSGTDLLQSIFNLFSTVGFENLYSLCCKSISFKVSSYAIEFLDGAQFKYKHKRWFVFYAFQLGRCTNQRWGAQSQTQQAYVLAQWFFDITEFFPETTVFYY